MRKLKKIASEIDVPEVIVDKIKKKKNYNKLHKKPDRDKEKAMKKRNLKTGNP